MSDLRIVFAGDRDVAVNVLRFVLAQGVRPLALLLPESERSSHARQLRSLCSHLGAERILIGRQFGEPAGLALLQSLAPDYVVCVHFPYLVPPAVLHLPSQGVLNLHPAYLPFNRGWHTPSWAILEDTPIGATLHFMDEGIDTGDIVAQELLPISPADTAHTLYQRVKELELSVFTAAWPGLASKSAARRPQIAGAGNSHRRSDLLQPQVRLIDLEAEMVAGDLIRRLRALTTDRLSEAAYFEQDGRRYFIQISITEVPEP